MLFHLFVLYRYYDREHSSSDEEEDLSTDDNNIQGVQMETGAADNATTINAARYQNLHVILHSLCMLACYKT